MIMVFYNPMTVFDENITGKNKYEESTKIKKWYHKNYSNN